MKRGQKKGVLTNRGTGSNKKDKRDKRVAHKASYIVTGIGPVCGGIRERTCDHLDPRLISLYEAIQTVVTGVMHLNFHHVKAHAKKGTPQYNLNNTEVDSMCTAVIKANDMNPRIQGPTHLAPFDAPKMF
jgi:hypothetical protein